MQYSSFHMRCIISKDIHCILLFLWKVIPYFDHGIMDNAWIGAVEMEYAFTYFYDSYFNTTFIFLCGYICRYTLTLTLTLFPHSSNEHIPMPPTVVEYGIGSVHSTVAPNTRQLPRMYLHSSAGCEICFARVPLPIFALSFTLTVFGGVTTETVHLVSF